MKVLEFFLMSWFGMGALIALCGLLWLQRTSCHMLRDTDPPPPVSSPVESMAAADK